MLASNRFGAALLACALTLSCSGEALPGEVFPQAAGLVPTVGKAPPAPPVRPKPVHGSLGAQVRAVGLMINGPTREQFGGEARLAFVGSRTRVALEVELPSGGIIDLDREASTLASFRDDRGTDLTLAETFSGLFEVQPQIAADGHSVVVVVAAESLPAAGASRLELQGTLALVTASLQKTHVAEQVELRSGQSFAVGPFGFRVTEAGPSQWSEEWSFTVETEDDLSALVSWTITDSQGQEHEASPWMTMSFNATTQQSLRCEEVQGPVKIALRAWSDSRRVEVPFQAVVGLGLR